MSPLKSAALSAAAALVLASPAFAQQAPSAAPTPIQQVFGRAPAVTGDVQRFSFPRSDLNVTVDGLKVQTALALGGWLAFHPMGGANHWEVMGDLVLTQEEIKPVEQKLVAGGLTFTAVH